MGKVVCVGGREVLEMSYEELNRKENNSER